MDDSLAPGSKQQGSRFASGRMQQARLIIPSLIQQAGLQPGDIIEDVPFGGRHFTEEELKTISINAELLGDLPKDEDVSDHASSSAVSSTTQMSHSTEKYPMTNESPLSSSRSICMNDTKESKAKDQPVKDLVLERPLVNHPTENVIPEGKPKRVSRWVTSSRS